MTIMPPLYGLANRVSQLILQENFNTSPQAHYELLRMIDQLKLAVETPTETVLRLIYQPPQNAALRAVMDLGIFPILTEKQNRPGISATQLAEYSGADRDLIVRLMRVIVSLGLCDASGVEVYRANDKTAALTQPVGRDGVPCIYDLTLPALSKLPQYLREHEYANPEEYTTSPMQWAVGQSQFEWLASHKGHQNLFNSYMASRREGRPMWYDVYPVERLLGHALPYQDSVLLVDIGGNEGHDLSRFRQKYPHVPGKLVLQDQPKVVAGVTGLGVEVMGYDFFDLQPIKGARAYYFRSIFHDWPDKVCQKILRNTVAAMAPDYSRVLIVDMVLPDTDTSLLQASLDIQMMSICAGQERSERQWRQLLESVGLSITGIWSQSPGMESVIEAVPACVRVSSALN